MALAIFIRAFYSIGVKSATTNVRVHYTTLSTLFLAASGLMALSVALFTGGIDIGAMMDHKTLVALGVLTMVIGNAVYFMGQDLVDAGTTQIALSTKLVWTALLAMPILGTRYDIWQVLGMLLLVAAVYMAANGLGKGAASWGALLIAISAVSFAFNTIFAADLATELDLNTYLFVSYIATAVFTLPFSIRFVRRDLGYLIATKRESARHIAMASLASLVYFVVIYYTFRAAGDDKGLVSVLTNAQVVTTVFLASILLGEKESLKRKSIAAILVLAAAYLISGA